MWEPISLHNIYSFSSFGRHKNVNKRNLLHSGGTDDDNDEDDGKIAIICFGCLRLLPDTASQSQNIYKMKMLLQSARDTIWNGTHVIWFDHSLLHINTRSPSLPFHFVQIQTYLLCLRIFYFSWEPFIYESANGWVRTNEIHERHTVTPRAKSHRKNYTTERLKKMVILLKYYSLLHHFSLLNSPAFYSLTAHLVDVLHG